MVNPHPSKTAASRFCSLCFIGSRHQRSSCRRWLQQRKWCLLHPAQRQYYPCGGSVARICENTLKSLKNPDKEAQFSLPSERRVSTLIFFSCERSLYTWAIWEYVWVSAFSLVFEETASFASENWSHTILVRAQLPKTERTSQWLNIRKNRSISSQCEESSSKESKF